MAVEVRVRYIIQAIGTASHLLSRNNVEDCLFGRLEQLQKKWAPVLRPELGTNKEIEHVGEPKFAGRALDVLARLYPLQTVAAFGQVLLTPGYEFGGRPG